MRSRTLALGLAVLFSSALFACASESRWYAKATGEIESATKANDQRRLATAYELRAKEWHDRAANPANFKVDRLAKYATSDFIAAATAFTKANIPSEAERVLYQCYHFLSTLGAGKECDLAYGERLKTLGDTAAYEEFRRGLPAREKDRAIGLRYLQDSNRISDLQKEEREKQEALDREETKQNIAILLNGVAEANSVRRGQPVPSTYHPTPSGLSQPTTNDAQSSPGGSSRSGSGYEVQLTPHRERVNLPGHSACISTQLRSENRSFSTYRISNSCAMALWVHYCYGSGCTRAVGGGFVLQSGEARTEVAEAHQRPIRVLQACSLTSGSEQVNYGYENQCYAHILMKK